MHGVMAAMCTHTHTFHAMFITGYTLQVACQNGQHECAGLLVMEGKAGVQERNSKTDWVALHEAALRGHDECCKVLLRYHAPLRPRTPDNDKPRDLAQRYGKTKVMELLGIVKYICEH